MRAETRANNAKLARISFQCACVCAGSLLFFDDGLYAFAVGLVIASVLQLRADWGLRFPIAAPVWVMLALAAAVIALVALSALSHDKPLRVLDNSMRLLLLPWCAWLAWRTGASRRGLWAGALLGIAVAFCIACWQWEAGELRASGSSNPLVFAHLLLILLAVGLLTGRIAHFRGAGLVAVMFSLLAGMAITLSGSRASLLAWALLTWLALVFRGEPAQRRRRAAWGAAAALLVVTLLMLLPALQEPLRLDKVSSDVARFSAGDADSPIGARLLFLHLAWQSFLAHPWQGVGIEGFGTVVQQWSGCQVRPQMGLCELAHAHNDLAEWGATLGLPGALAILAIYGVPLAMFVAIIRRADPRTPNLAAWGGAAVIGVYVWCGLTQSMFAHAATATAYALFTGVLLGVALRDAEATT
ncbi:MAG TPA: O-antigen ligase family protein [Pseudoxanthomonas sp.]|nr:O-antigen ligase family protein [Pseudoxanthomonas sp.]